MQHEESLLSERDSTHGDIVDNAAVYEALGKAFWESASVGLLENPLMALPIDLIILKLSRIATGDYTFDDHWDDLSGYALLGKKLTKAAWQS